MHDLEPFYNWRHLYIASEDERSPFYERNYNEFEFTHQIYNYLIHPQWDHFGSDTLYCKILFVNYEEHFCVIEMLGEWNDTLYNDIMFFKRNVIEPLEGEEINKFILIGENVLLFHSSDDAYYEEWFDDIEDGWIAFINFRDQVIQDFKDARLDYYIAMGDPFREVTWRRYTPAHLYNRINEWFSKRLPA